MSSPKVLFEIVVLVVVGNPITPPPLIKPPLPDILILELIVNAS